MPFLKLGEERWEKRKNSRRKKSFYLSSRFLILCSHPSWENKIWFPWPFPGALITSINMVQRQSSCECHDFACSFMTTLSNYAKSEMRMRENNAKFIIKMMKLWRKNCLFAYDVHFISVMQMHENCPANHMLLAIVHIITSVHLVNWAIGHMNSYVQPVLYFNAQDVRQYKN